MKITEESQIDTNKLARLFRSRGHGKLNSSTIDLIFQVFDGKLTQHSVFQCNCGEISIMDNETAKIVAERLHLSSEDLPCKVCGDYREITVDLSLVQSLDSLVEAISKGKVDVKSSEMQFLLRLVPSPSPEEFRVGLDALIQAITSNFPSRKSKFQQMISDLGKAAKTRNHAEFTRYIKSISFDRLNMQKINYLNAMEVVQAVRGNRDLSRLLGDTVDPNDVREINALHSAYLEMVEDTDHAKILENLRRIAAGLFAELEPFASAMLPPIIPSGRPRKVTSLSDTAEYLSLSMPNFKLREIYNNHLRNAKGHNEYEIDIQQQQIKLLQYNEVIKFDELVHITEDLYDLFLSIDEFISEEISRALRTNRMFGITNMVLGYDVPEIVGDQLVPIGNSPPELVVYQSWAFSQNNILRALDIKLEILTDELAISVVGQESTIHFPLDDKSKRWLKQAVIMSELNIAIYIVAPPFPNFYLESEYVIPVGDTGRNVYVLDIQEQRHLLKPKILKEISERLGFDPSSEEAKMLKEQSRRLEVINKQKLTARLVRELAYLQKESFDCMLIPVVSSTIGIPKHSEFKEIFFDVSSDAFEYVKDALYGIAGGITTIKWRSSEGITFCICEICNLANWKAVLFPFYFAENLQSELMSYENLSCYFRPHDGEPIGLILPSVTWEPLE